MAPHTPTPTEHKLLLLRALDRLGPVTAQQLLRFMVETEAMDYITLQLSLAELVDTGLLRKVPHAIGMLYTPSTKGDESLRMFLNRVPPSRLQQIDEQAEAFRALFKREKQLLADWTRVGPMAYNVRLRVLENDATLLDMTLSVPTREQALHFCEGWHARAATVYAQIMNAMGEDVGEGQDLAGGGRSTTP